MAGQPPLLTKRQRRDTAHCKTRKMLLRYSSHISTNWHGTGRSTKDVKTGTRSRPRHNRRLQLSRRQAAGTGRFRIRLQQEGRTWQDHRRSLARKAGRYHHDKHECHFFIYTRDDYKPPQQMKVLRRKVALEIHKSRKYLYRPNLRS